MTWTEDEADDWGPVEKGISAFFFVPLGIHYIYVCFLAVSRQGFDLGMLFAFSLLGFFYLFVGGAGSFWSVEVYSLLRKGDKRDALNLFLVPFFFLLCVAGFFVMYFVIYFVFFDVVAPILGTFFRHFGELLEYLFEIPIIGDVCSFSCTIVFLLLFAAFIRPPGGFRDL